MIKHIGIKLLWNMATEFRSPFLTIMADETTDASNQEQVTLFVHWINDDLQVQEDFVGLYSVHSIDADMLVTVINDAFLRLNLSFDRVRGQCYDGVQVL